MAGEAAGEAILFIGAVLAAGLVTGTLTGVAGHYVDNLRANARTAEAERTGRIALVNDPANVPNNPVILYVKNIGDHVQHLSGFVLLVDGTPRTTWTATINGAPATDLGVGQLVALSITGLDLAAGDHEARVVSDTNSVASLSFTE